MSILKELYNGNICPCERSVRKGSEFHRLSQIISETESRLLTGLTAEQKALYEVIFENIYQQQDISETEIFAEGFRLGASTMLEVLIEPEKQLPQI